MTGKTNKAYRNAASFSKMPTLNKSLSEIFNTKVGNNLKQVSKCVLCETFDFNRYLTNSNKVFKFLQFTYPNEAKSINRTRMDSKGDVEILNKVHASRRDTLTSEHAWHVSTRARVAR